MQLFKLNIIYEMLYTVYIYNYIYIYIIHIMMTNAGDKRSKQTLESKSQTNNLSNAIKFLGHKIPWAFAILLPFTESTNRENKKQHLWKPILTPRNALPQHSSNIYINQSPLVDLGFPLSGFSHPDYAIGIPIGCPRL